MSIKLSALAITIKARNMLASMFCTEPPCFTLLSSFKLVGGVIVVSGKAELDSRDKRVATASARLKRGRYAPIAFSQKVQMIQTAIIPVALYGCELQPLTKRQCDNLRRRTSSCLFKGHSLCRSPSANFTFNLPGHKVDIVQATLYHTVQTARRFFQRRSDLHSMFETLVEHILATGRTFTGPATTLYKVFMQMDCVWLSPWRVQIREDEVLELLDMSSDWSHRLRNQLRQMVWREGPFQKRLDMDGARPELIDYESTVALSRKFQKSLGKSNGQLAPRQLVHLRAILTGAIYTWERLVKGNQVNNAQCPFCHQEDEDVEHVLWRCSAWNSQRSHLLQRYSSVFLESLPICTRQCGTILLDILPNAEESVNFAKHLHTCYINILEAREKYARLSQSSQRTAMLVVSHHPNMKMMSTFRL